MTKLQSNWLTPTITALLISACGGAGVAAFSFIAPIGGNYQTTDSNATLDFKFDQPLSTSHTGILSAVGLPVPANCTNDNSEYTVTITDNTFTAFKETTKTTQCFTGTFNAIHKITVETTDTNNLAQTIETFREPQPHLNIERDIWINVDDASHRFKFTRFNGTAPTDSDVRLRGCEVKNNVNQQEGKAIDLWLYKTPMSNPQPHLLQSNGAGQTANFEGYGRLIISENGKTIATMERRVDDGKTTCAE